MSLATKFANGRSGFFLAVSAWAANVLQLTKEQSDFRLLSYTLYHYTLYRWSFEGRPVSFPSLFLYHVLVGRTTRTASLLDVSDLEAVQCVNKGGNSDKRHTRL